MGDFSPETKRWIERVKTCGYMYSIMWECQWDNTCKTDVEVRGHVDSYSLTDVLNPRDVLYGCCCEDVLSEAYGRASHHWSNCPEQTT